MNKLYRTNQQYIKQRYNEKTRRWSFQVRYNNICKSFNEKDYLNASDAFKAALEFRNNLIVGNVDKNESTPTVQEIYNLFPMFYSLKDETYRKYGIFFNSYINHKDKPIADVKIEDIQFDLNSMSNSCSLDTITRVKSIWQKIFKIAIIKGYCKSNLVDFVETPKSRKIQNKKTNKTIDEKSILDLSIHLSKHLSSEHERYYAPFILKTLFLTGMRPSEMFALTKKDIDMNKHTITINKRVDSSRDAQTIETTKTNESNRIIPFSSKLAPIFKELLKKDSDLIFPDPEGNYYLPAQLSDKYHKNAKRIGIDFHMYQCRFAFITNLYMNGVDIKTIQELVGQKIDFTTLGYVVSSEERMKNALKFV